jgi:hypothetical protein
MQCPVCHKDNDQGPACQRCKADLGLLFALEEQRAREEATARHCLANQQWSQARQHAERMHWLRRDEASRRLLAVTALLTRDFPQAWAYYQAISPTRQRGT